MKQCKEQQKEKNQRALESNEKKKKEREERKTASILMRDVHQRLQNCGTLSLLHNLKMILSGKNMKEEGSLHVGMPEISNRLPASETMGFQSLFEEPTAVRSESPLPIARCCQAVLSFRSLHRSRLRMLGLFCPLFLTDERRQ